MKKLFLLGTLLAFSGLTTVQAGYEEDGYSPNTGQHVPGTFHRPDSGQTDPMPETKSIKSTADIRQRSVEQEQERAKISAPESGVESDHTGINFSEMNTSPNPTPGESNQTDKFDRTLSTGEINPRGPAQQKNGPLPDSVETREAEEEELDYSTSPGRQQ